MSTTPLTKIALAGASGALGTPILTELLASGFTVTALTRPESKTTFPPTVTVKKVDYTSHSSLLSALQGQDAVISTLGHSSIEDQQYALFTAAIEAGVKRILPSEFGSDTTVPASQEFPVYVPKIAVQKWLREKTEGTETSYTIVMNNAFLDWGIDMDFLLKVKEKKVTLWDGGETEYSVTPLSGVAKGVVGILRKPEETKNRVVKIHGAVLTQKKLLALAQKAVGEDGWTVEQGSTETGLQEAKKNFQADPANVWGWILGFLYRAIFSVEHSPKFGDEDSKLLGVPQVSDDEIVEIIKKSAAK